MKWRRLFVVLLIALITGVFFNWFCIIAYDINIFEYYSKSKPLTQEEKAWLESRDSLIYGSDQNAPPLRYLDKETGQYKGIVVDYIRALSIELETEIVFKPYVWEDALTKLEKAETDMCDMIPSSERSQKYVFSDPIYNMRGIIAVKSNSGINVYKELTNKKVAIPEGDYAIEFLKNRVTGIDFVLTEDMLHAMDLLREGKVDAVAGDEPVITYYMNELEMNDSFRIAKNVMYENKNVLAVPKSEEILVNILNKGIFKLKRQNIISKIEQKWSGFSVPLKTNNTKEVILFGATFSLLLVGILLYLFYSWNRVLKSEVDKRTLEIQKKTEELFISRNDLQTTFDGLKHFMAVLDTGGNILNINQSITDYLKKSKNDIIGENIYILDEMKFVNRDEDIIHKTLINGTSYQTELENNGKIWEISTFPLEGTHQKVQKVLLMIKDITKAKLDEQKIMHESKMAAIGHLATGVAHEIRNPLGLIRNNAFFIRSEIEDGNMKKNQMVMESIDMIEDSVEKASNIIDNLLNFSRLSGVEKETVAMKTFIDSIIALERNARIKKECNIEVVCDKELICMINQEAMKHILINLISNGIDAVPQGGLVSIACTKHNHLLIITCRDNGTGMNDETKKNIFHPYYTTKPAGEGTGLGLYIVYSEIKKLGGQISVSSALGEGTVFEVRIPVEEGDECNE